MEGNSFIPVHLRLVDNEGADGSPHLIFINIEGLKVTNKLMTRTFNSGKYVVFQLFIKYS